MFSVWRWNFLQDKKAQVYLDENKKAQVYLGENKKALEYLNEKLYKYQDLAGVLEKCLNMKETMIPIVFGTIGIVQKNNWNDLHRYTTKIGEDTEKSPGDLRWLAVMIKSSKT